jgi:drug/metabolite transporter (DMT)-like permease
MWKKQLDVLDKIYYMRAFLGVICGIILGFIFNSMGLNSNSSVVPYSPSIIFMVALFFYIISYVIAKRIGLRLKTEDKKKIATNGIFPFIFLVIMFLIVTYTGLYTGRQ